MNSRTQPPPDDWTAKAKKILVDEMKTKGMSRSDLAKKLGMPKLNLDRTIARGTFSTAFFLRTLDILDSHHRDVHFGSEPAEGNRKYRHADGHSFVDTRGLANVRLEDNKVISLFSGAGGMDIGLESAGFKNSCCIEIDKDCRATLKANRPSWRLYTSTTRGRTAGDIRDISGKELLTFSGCKYGEPALILGGVPCQSFSLLGKKEGESCPRNGDLFRHFVRIVGETMPKGFIFENVLGITEARHANVIQCTHQAFDSLGYKISYTVLDAADYGVPQRRRRYFVLGLRDGEPLFPLPTHSESLRSWKRLTDKLTPHPACVPDPWLTVGDALKALPDDHIDRDDCIATNHSDKIRKAISMLGPGEGLRDLPDEYQPPSWRGKEKEFDVFSRAWIDRPSCTVRCFAYNPYTGRYVHPVEDRGYNSVELSALQSFPYSWQFRSAGRQKVTLTSVTRQIGNAVPPMLAKALGLALKSSLL